MSVDTLDCNTNAYLKLINLVKSYPILYNRNELILDSQNFRRNQKEINHSWQLIASELGVSVGECKRRWKTLKETFCRVQKRNLENTDNFDKKKWVYEDALSFLLNTKKDNLKSVASTMEKIVHVASQPDEVQEDVVEYIELDMDSIGDSEYYIMDTSASDREPGEIIKIATPLNPNQVIVNNKTFQKYITICDSSQNGLENATIVNVDDLEKNNFIITTPLVEEGENTEYILSNGVEEELTTNGQEENTKQTKDLKQDLYPESVNTSKPLSKRKLQRINELLQMPGNEKSIEDFFENMAQIVLQLPTKLQAEVKMEICNIVSMSEITFSQNSSLLK